MFKISSLIFNKGKSVTHEFKGNNIVVFVGPNNSGKSTVLRDIEKWFEGDQEMRILRDVEISINQNPSFYSDFKKDILEFEDGERLIYNNAILHGFYFRHIIKGSLLQQCRYDLNSVELEYRKGNVKYFKNNFMKFFVCRLDGRMRFRLIEDMPYHTSNSANTSMNLMTRLIRDRIILHKLSQIIYDEFKWYPCLRQKTSSNNVDKDITLLVKEPAEFYLSSGECENNEWENSNKSIMEYGDGVKCFLSICLAVVGFPFRVVLLDEPEAYMHPPLAKNLGKRLSKITIENDSTLIVSTHSADFLLGCLETSPELTVIRITYNGKRSKTTKLQQTDVLEIAKNALLRSTNVLNAFFHRSTIILEGNTDRVFYEEINSKLTNEGIVDTLFLPSVGKNVIHVISDILRKLEIPAVSAYDFDILDERKDNEGLFEKILMTNNVMSDKIDTYLTLQKNLENFVNLNHKEGDPDPYRNQGVRFLDGDLKKDITLMLEELKKNGIFVVPYGEVETWLQELNIQEKKAKWLVKVLKFLPSTRITNDNVWKFMRDMSSYIESSIPK